MRGILGTQEVLGLLRRKLRHIKHYDLEEIPRKGARPIWARAKKAPRESFERLLNLTQSTQLVGGVEVAVSRATSR